MKRLVILPEKWLILGLGILLLGCTSLPPANSSGGTPISQNETQASPTPAPTPFQGQMLPVSATAKFADTSIELEVTRTPEEQAMGLMYRTSLPDNRGMLFQFDPPRPVNFWMKNVKIPLDMVFLRAGVVTAIEANVPPCRSDPCPTYGPNTPIDQVIELRGGRAAQLRLRVGQRVEVRFLQSSRE